VRAHPLRLHHKKAPRSPWLTLAAANVPGGARQRRVVSFSPRGVRRPSVRAHPVPGPLASPGVASPRQTHRHHRGGSAAFSSLRAHLPDQASREARRLGPFVADVRPQRPPGSTSGPRFRGLLRERFRRVASTPTFRACASRRRHATPACGSQ
jgi:hypothetical protein